MIKYDLYQREGVTFYGLVYPEAKKVKLYRLEDGQYRKVADFHDQRYRFGLSKCSLDVDFAALWP